MGAITLALLLLSAFLQSNRAFFSISRMDDERQACHEALLSLSEYLRFKFEEDRNWGQGEWKGPEIVPLSGSRVLFSLAKVPGGAPEDGHGLSGRRHLIGEGPEQEVKLHIAFSNNLDRDTGTEMEIFDENGRRAKEQVPAKTCFIRISARRGNYTEKAEVSLRRTAFFDSTLASSDGIDIKVKKFEDGGDAVVFNSRDPVRNQIRSGADIRLPHRRLLGFRANEGTPPPTKGTVWSKGDVYFADSKRPEDIAATAREHNLEIVSQAKNHYDIPELTADDIEVGSNPAGTADLSGRKYIFTQAEVTYDRPDGSSNTLEMRVLKEINPDTDVVETFHYNRNDINEVVGSVRINPKPGESGIIPDDLRGTARGDDEFTVDGGKIRVQMRGEDFVDNGVLTRVNSEPRMVLPKTAKVDGPFIVKADDHNLVPTISFGDEETKGYLSAKEDINLEGYIKGGGKILSREGSVHLRPNDVDVESDERIELAVYAKKHVVIARPNNDQAENENSEAGAREFYFKGLIYAGQGFEFRADSRYNRRLVVEGAVVARNGKIDIDSQNGVRLIYNPAFLDDFLEKSALERKVQVEELSWRPI